MLMPCDTTGGSIVDAPWDRIFVLQGKQMIVQSNYNYFLLNMSRGLFLSLH